MDDKAWTKLFVTGRSVSYPKDSVIVRDGVATDDLPASLQHYGVPTDGAQLVSLVHNHRLSLATVAVLLFFLLVMNLALVVGMRWLHADRRWSAQYAGYGAVMASD